MNVTLIYARPEINKAYFYYLVVKLMFYAFILV